MGAEQQKLFDSLQSAVRSNNYDLVINVLIGEVGFLLKNDKKGLIKSVREAGGNAGDNISDADLAKMVSYALINKHKPFIDRLLELILKEENSYHNIDSDVGSVAAAGISAIGSAIVNAQYGNQISNAEKNLNGETKEEQALELANKIIAKKDTAKLKVSLSQTDAAVLVEQQKNYAQVGLIFGGTFIISLIIWIAYKASKNT